MLLNHRRKIPFLGHSVWADSHSSSSIQYAKKRKTIKTWQGKAIDIVRQSRHCQAKQASSGKTMDIIRQSRHARQIKVWRDEARQRRQKLIALKFSFPLLCSEYSPAPKVAIITRKRHPLEGISIERSSIERGWLTKDCPRAIFPAASYSGPDLRCPQSGVSGAGRGS